MDKIMRAANEIRHFAVMLHASHTLEGKWCDEEGKAEHDRLIALAADLEAARQPERGEAVAWLRKNGFRFNGDIEPQDDSELPLYTHPDSGRVAELEARLAASREREVKLIADLDANLEAYSDERKRALSAENLARELHELLTDYVSQDSIAQGYGSGVGGTTYQKAEAFLDALAADKENSHE